MRKPKNQPGDFIVLYWDGDAQDLYVHGHVTEATFRTVIAAEHGGSVESADFGSFPEFAAPVHRWARFVFSGVDEYGNPTREIRTYPEKGRGAFPVTVASVSRWHAFAKCKADHLCWLREGHSGPHWIRFVKDVPDAR